MRRIDGVLPRSPVQLSIMVDIDTRRVLSARVRLRSADDVRDVHSLMRHSTCTPWQVLMDKGYDSELLHEWFSQRGVRSIALTRKRCTRGWYRKRLRDAFPEQEYHQRSIVESVIGSIKQRFGGTILCHTARTVRAELFMRLIIYNITTLIRLFLQRLLHGNFYKSLDDPDAVP